MVAILIISAKLVAVGFLQTNLFWNEDYDFKVTVHDVNKKPLSRDSNYIADMVM